MSYTRGAGLGEHGGPKYAWYWTGGMFTTRCRARACAKDITLAKSVKTGRYMPFDPPIRAVDTRMVEDVQKPGTWHQAMLVDLAQSHFATCVEARRFSNRPRMR